MAIGQRQTLRGRWRTPGARGAAKRLPRPPAGERAELGSDKAARIHSQRGGGIPLPEADRAFFEPRLGRGLAGVRLHHDATAAALSNELDARAVTVGADVFIGGGEYHPGTQSGRRLMAHELAHVLQQQAGDAPVRRQTIDASCSSARAAIITEAWNTARGDPVKTQRMIIDNSFGDVAFISGISRLGDRIGSFQRLAAAFSAGRTLKCNPPGSGSGECATYEACVVDGNNTNIFLNDSFFDTSKSAEQRGVTLIHELAHSAPHAEHGSTGDTAVFGCETAPETSYEQARNNAYSYEMLMSCASGLLQPASVQGAQPAEAPAAGAPDSGLRLGASAGIGFGIASGVDSDAARFVGSVTGRYTFGLGECTVFSPGIGFGLLYLSPTKADPQHVAAVTSEFAGIGWQWKALEIGPELRGQLPLTEGDEPGMIVMGRFQVHTP